MKRARDIESETSSGIIGLELSRVWSVRRETARFRVPIGLQKAVASCRSSDHSKSNRELVQSAGRNSKASVKE